MKGKLFSNHGHNFFFVICALVFTFLISVGYTGSSVSCFDSPFFAPLARTIYGKGQAVRSDEYAVNLMSYISQLNNSENSNYNKNYGVEGKKMGIVHDFGSPTFEFYDISKPATWGFYLPIPFKSKIAWWWVTPLFISCLGLFFLLQQIIPKQGPFNLLISIAFTFTPYNSVWSFSPSYIVGLGAIALGCQIYCLRTNLRRPYLCLLAQFFSAIAASGFLLTLYLPHIVGPAMVFIVLYLVYLCAFFKADQAKIRAYFISLSVFFIFSGICIYDWWINNSDAVKMILSSAYPGKREVLGGGMAIDGLIRGSFNFAALILNNKGFQIPPNICEFVSEYLFFLPLTLIFIEVVRSGKGSKKLFYLLSGLLIIYTLTLFYQYVGLGELSKLLFWNKTKEVRMNITIILIQYLMISYLLKLNVKTSFLAQASILIISVIIWFASFNFSKSFGNLSDLTWVIFSFSLFLILIFLLLNNIKYLIVTLSILSLAGFVIFHPVNLALDFKASPITSYILAKKGVMPYGGRTATFGDWRYANSGVAAGIPIINSVLHYKDGAQEEALFSNYKERRLLNRFHHSMLELGEFQGDTSETSIPQGDVIKTVFSHDYDFSKLPIDFVVGPENFADGVTSLKKILTYRGCTLYSVKRKSNSNIN